MDGDNNENEGSRLDSATEEQQNISIHAKYPSRRMSLEPVGDDHPHPSDKSALAAATGTVHLQDRHGSAPSGREIGNIVTPVRVSSLSRAAQWERNDANGSQSPQSTVLLPQELLPAPDPEADLPFDFHRFLEQLRHRTADPVAKYLRSFLAEFGKKQWMAHEQVKFINDFLTFIANKMASCEVWRGVSSAEFDNAKEGMEKLVMNRLYSQTFSPAILPPASLSDMRGKKKTSEVHIGPGRGGQHQEDVERDDILNQKVRIYGWVQEEHLDIPPVGSNGKRLLNLAQQGIMTRKQAVFLLSLSLYRAPQDQEL